MAETNWMMIADLLASRLFSQAFICPEGHTQYAGGNLVAGPDPTKVHRDPFKFADTCPFCADTAAYLTWKKARYG
jgi:hypothetical protein